MLVQGLSPLTRGSPSCSRPRRYWTGSIPAHTGKPSRRRRLLTGAGVYPRSHGEARRCIDRWPTAWGLSPLTRGSLEGVRPVLPWQGSIPAHTGKPRLIVRSLTHDRVYPRSHGEAIPETAVKSSSSGLSPLTRGSLMELQARMNAEGSIPAHTGKPSRRPRPGRRRRVYPRSHGEASLQSSHAPLCTLASLAVKKRSSTTLSLPAGRRPRCISPLGVLQGRGD